jgi:RNA polymerase sigma-70 factor, ECF subfamily
MAVMEHPDGAWPWDQWRGVCLREARRLSQTAADAEDAVQEAFARAWRKRDQCREPDAALCWILQITRNEAHRLRSAGAGQDRRADRLVELRETRLVEEPHDGPAIDRVDVRRALENLTEHERSLILLRYAADLTQEASARALGIPEGTAKFRLHRTRMQLREMLTADDRQDQTRPVKSC